MLRWVRLVITNYYAFTGQMVNTEMLLQTALPDELWNRIENFLESMACLPCWMDKNLSGSVFGPKQNLDYWDSVFKTAKSPGGTHVLAVPLDLHQMVQGPKAGARAK